MKAVLSKIFLPVLMVGMFLTGGQAIAKEPEKTEDINQQVNVCLKRAFDAVNIPNAYFQKVDYEDGRVMFYKKALTPYPAPHNDIDSVVSAEAVVEQCGRKVSFAVHHDGTQSLPLEDAADASIVITFDEDEVRRRSVSTFGALTDEPLSKRDLYSQWTIYAIQKAEDVFDECMGMDRPARFSFIAETSLNIPPPHSQRK